MVEKHVVVRIPEPLRANPGVVAQMKAAARAAVEGVVREWSSTLPAAPDLTAVTADMKAGECLAPDVELAGTEFEGAAEPDLTPVVNLGPAAPLEPELAVRTLRDGGEVFVLRDQDVCAARAVEAYARELESHRGRSTQLRDAARELYGLARRWAMLEGRKLPD